jgi:hypothetical protein
MSFNPCSVCGQRQNGKIATVYSNWIEEGGSRRAFKQWYCALCLTELAVYLKELASDGSSLTTDCMKCAGPLSEGFRLIWLKVYPPHSVAREFAITMCVSCAASLQTRLQEGASVLPDRNARAAALASEDDEQWDAIPW